MVNPAIARDGVVVPAAGDVIAGLAAADGIVARPAVNGNARMRGGSGIVLDDIVAGLYANIVLQFFYRIL